MTGRDEQIATTHPDIRRGDGTPSDPAAVKRLLERIAEHERRLSGGGRAGR